MEFDALTTFVLIGAVYGPIAAYQAAARPARPWASVPARLRLLVIASLSLTAIGIVVLAAIGRWPLALLLAVSSGLSYFVARRRRAQRPQ